MKSRRRCASGLTLIEVLVAVAVLGLALLAWAGLQARLTKVERSNQVRRELAAWMRSELRLQRNVRALDCRSRAAPAGWSCSVARTCLGGTTICDAEVVHVTITPPEGRPWAAATGVWWPLQRAPVGATP